MLIEGRWTGRTAVDGGRGICVLCYVGRRPARCPAYEPVNKTQYLELGPAQETYWVPHSVLPSQSLARQEHSGI
jgi:hypothetical protein